MPDLHPSLTTDCEACRIYGGTIRDLLADWQAAGHPPKGSPEHQQIGRALAWWLEHRDTHTNA